jgi:mannose-6-phosphate isomerase-like protein (cupin superfamily)
MARTKSKASARRASPRTAAKRTVARKTGSSVQMRRRPARPLQRFVVSHHREEDFESGLRAYANYRDLGIAQATNGMVRAHVIRFIPPCRPEEVSKRHYHDVEFQMIYVLKGWIKTELDGQGAIVMRAGSAWIQPPRIEHVVLDYSNDCEVLEVILPADFATVELEKPTPASRRQ